MRYKYNSKLDVKIIHKHTNICEHFKMINVIKTIISCVCHDMNRKNYTNIIRKVKMNCNYNKNNITNFVVVHKEKRFEILIDIGINTQERFDNAYTRRYIVTIHFYCLWLVQF